MTINDLSPQPRAVVATQDESLREVTEKELFAHFLVAPITYSSRLCIKRAATKRLTVADELFRLYDTPACLGDEFSDALIEGLLDAERPRDELDWVIAYLSSLVANLTVARDLFHDLMEANSLPGPYGGAPNAQHLAWDNDRRFWVRVDAEMPGVKGL